MQLPDDKHAEIDHSKMIDWHNQGPPVYRSIRIPSQEYLETGKILTTFDALYNLRRAIVNLGRTLLNQWRNRITFRVFIILWILGFILIQIFVK